MCVFTCILFWLCLSAELLKCFHIDFTPNALCLCMHRGTFAHTSKYWTDAQSIWCVKTSATSHLSSEFFHIPKTSARWILLYWSYVKTYELKVKYGRIITLGVKEIRHLITALKKERWKKKLLTALSPFTVTFRSLCSRQPVSSDTLMKIDSQDLINIWFSMHSVSLSIPDPPISLQTCQTLSNQIRTSGTGFLCGAVTQTRCGYKC